MNLESRRPSGPLFRVGRDDEAWAIPDWAYAKEDGTFGNRFDDPMGVYRVLYASSQRLGCFIETLARFRVDVSFVADLALMENGEDDFTAFGTVRRAWLWRFLEVALANFEVRATLPAKSIATITKKDHAADRDRRRRKKDPRLSGARHRRARLARQQNRRKDGAARL
jgi:hypothetical protein